MDRISKCRDNSQFLQSFGWFLLGIGVTALFAAISTYISVDFAKVLPSGQTGMNIQAYVAEWIFGVLALGCLISGGVTLKYAKTHRQDRTDYLQVIVEDMQAKSDRFEVGKDAPLP